MNNFVKIVKYTVFDVLHQKSFFVLLAICIGFVLLLRGCYTGNYVVNGQSVNNLTVAWNASIGAFHVVCVGAILIATILSMSILRRDKEDGSLVYLLSKPIDRSVYVLGRAVGLWIVSSGFMFVLHLTIFIMTFANAGGVMPGYLTASALCFVNVLFVVLLIFVLSLYMSDFAAAFFGIVVVAISYISDTIFRVMQSSMVQSALGAGADTHVSTWRMLWPKVASFQYFAVSLVDKSHFSPIGTVHPLFIMCAYILLLATLLVVGFKKKEL